MNSSTALGFVYGFCFPLGISFSTRRFVFYYCFCFILQLMVNLCDSLQPIFKPVVKQYFFISGNLYAKI